MHSGFVWHFCQSCLIFTTFLFECSHSKNKWFSKEQFEENSINIMSSFIWIDSQYLPLCFARQEILPRNSSEYRHDIHQCKLIINIKKQVRYLESNVTNVQTWNSGYLHEPTTFYMALFYVFANVIIILFYCATADASLEPIKLWPFVDWFRKNVTISHIK